MLAFLVVILVAVGTVALLTGRVTENAFRRYTLTRSGMWEGLTTRLAGYYGEHGSWDGIQVVLPTLRNQWLRGKNREVASPGAPPMMIDFRVVDAQGVVVGDTRGVPQGRLSRDGPDDGVVIEADGETVGYLLPQLRNQPAWPMDSAQDAFLSRVRRTLWVGAGAALTVALILGGLLFRSITAPLRELTAASEAIARGNLSARADIGGRDEVAQLADAFNSMASSLHRMEEARRNQTADIAHELRTPLTVLQGTLEAMLDRIYPTNCENLAAALGQTHTLGRLIEDLRLLALADAGRLHLKRNCLDLSTLLEEIVEAYQPQAQERGIVLEARTPADLPNVCVDRDRLSQVVGNLLSNSLHYVPWGGRVSVAVETLNGQVQVSVIDNGPGVSPRDLPHVFDRFWRADAARRRATGGSGLGLSIVRHIVEAHGGRVWAEETPGGGLTVALLLPAQ
jgi:signal transduction histidine kinase